ncbi:HECT-like ubiquitin-conjugating enzyme-binding-domain-containing protein [Schizophyllum commune]
MATLTRPKVQEQEQLQDDIAAGVPTPFPEQFLTVPREIDTTQQATSRSLPQDEASGAQASSSRTGLHEVLPSISYVQKSCLTTLNNLLAVPADKWAPIVPDRRHSMPPTPNTASMAEKQAANPDTYSSALHTLVSNLRSREEGLGAGSAMMEIKRGTTDSELIRELKSRVGELAPALDARDFHLASILVSLLSHFDRLCGISDSSPSGLVPSAPSSRPGTSDSKPRSPLEPSVDLTDPFSNLRRQLSDFQVERQTSGTPTSAPGSPPVVAVEAALLWTRIDEELDTVVRLCKERTLAPAYHLPPEYDAPAYEAEHPPEYDEGHAPAPDDKTKAATSATAAPPLNEKTRMDLEAITLAIDRLYLVAPQLHNQRVELRSSKVQQLERARMAGSSSSTSSKKGKQKEKESDIRELENILELLGKATERSLKDQSYVLEGGMQSRLERAKQRDDAKRTAFVEQLAQHSDARRFHGQDAAFQPPRERAPEQLLSLPEFMREPIPAELIRRDPNALLSLPEFVRESMTSNNTEDTPSSPPPPPSSSMQRLRHSKSLQRMRSRSMSVPSFPWLKSSSRSRSGSVTRDQAAAKEADTSRTAAFEVTYVAEHHDSLQNVLAFFTVTGAPSGADIEAEVFPVSSNNAAEGGDRLVIKCASNASVPLSLPARVAPGKKPVTTTATHYEMKIPTLAGPPAPDAPSPYEPVPLLDATQLKAGSPTSFLCASCSLPLVQSGKLREYSDLPSEYWEELVEAWMCHADQKLNERVMSAGRGLWPAAGEALVGGSYVLFDQTSVSSHNLRVAEQARRGEEWRHVRCLCGSYVGRCRDHQPDGGERTVTYRLLKYAMRPIGPSVEPVRIPLSAYIVEDLTELVQAHACHRFILFDEEDEQPRILLWLFKPSIRIAYALSKPYALPRRGAVHAAKVLFKLLGPSEGHPDLKATLERYPGFPQAEYLYYPMSVCQQLAALLRQSNQAYPEAMRTMTGLDVGWLQRA